jgi:hypothetical protein
MQLRAKRSRLAALVAVGALIGGLLASLGAVRPAVAVPAGTATVTVVHGVPNTAVDVYVDGTDVLPDFTFGTVSPPLTVPAGSHDVEIKLAGTSTVALSGTVDLTAGENATAVANLTTTGSLALNVYQNPTTPAPTGDAWVLVRHTAQAPPVDVYAGSTKVVTALANPDTAGPLAVPAGTVPVSVAVSPSTPSSTPVLGPLPLTLAAGNVSIVYAIGVPGTSLTAVVQSYTVGTTPPPPNAATVTVVHGIPGATVDVYVNGTVVLPGFTFGTVSPALSLAPGTYSVAVKAAGTDTTILSATATLSAGENATIVANLSATGTPELTVFQNPTTPAPPGEAWVLVRHTAEAPAVDVYAGSTRVVTALTNPNSAGPLAVPAGTLPVSVKVSPSTPSTAPVLGPLGLNLTAGHVYIAYAIGSATASPSTLTVALQSYAVGNRGGGYLLSGRDGGLFAFGDATFQGSLPGLGVHVDDIVDLAATADAKGYWQVGADGGLFAFGDAGFFGSVPGLGIHVDNIVDVLPSADGQGYLEIGSDGGVYAFGDATFHGSVPGSGIHVNNIVAAANTPDGGGYWLIGSDGGVYAYGDATYHGSVPGAGATIDNAVGILPTADGQGYTIAASDGGVFAFGDAPYTGSLPGLGVHVDNVIGIIGGNTLDGSLLIGSDGGVFAFGGATFAGSLPGLGVAVDDIVAGTST